MYISISRLLRLDDFSIAHVIDSQTKTGIEQVQRSSIMVMGLEQWLFNTLSRS
jgi:hypothetical protein